ncbi:hypothetical protein ONS96_002544 [Cadophora gregata f. sp. sojae]|nr:hypothetical protein ONS96_002544 [Cadophora gregata f. sp. sojae]
MLGIRDGVMETAAAALAEAGFIRQRWSYGSTIDPATRKDDEMLQRVHARIGLAFANFDAKTIRFHYPNDDKLVQRTILIPSSYLHLAVCDQPSTPDSAPTQALRLQPSFYVDGNLYYPNVVELLRSFIEVYLDERKYTAIPNWQAKLLSWAFGYLYGELLLRDDILDDCESEMVKQFF